MSNMMNRPKIPLPKTQSEWIWDIVGYFCYIGAILFLVFYWNELPDQVPAHFNAMGEVDRWGSKWELFVLPGIGLFIILLMQGLEKFPELHNYPKLFNEKNAKKFYLQSRKLVNQIKNCTLIFFALIMVESAMIALGWENSFEGWVFPIWLIGMGIIIVSGIVKLNKIQ